jgi:hypothetical protein
VFLSANSRVTGGRAARGAAFMAGTQLAFINAFAPVGWVRVATFDDALMRIVGSAAPASGGANGFVATFNSQTVTGAHTLTQAELPAVALSSTSLFLAAAGSATGINQGTGAAINQATVTTGNMGSGSSHTHPITTSIKYVDALIARKS